MQCGISTRYDALSFAYHQRNKHILGQVKFPDHLTIPGAFGFYVNLAEMHLGVLGIVIEGFHDIGVSINHVQLTGHPRYECDLQRN